MSDQQLATADQANAPEAAAMPVTRRGLKLPAFPVAAAPPIAVPSAAAPSIARELRRPKPSTTEYLRRFPLIPSRPPVGDEHSAGSEHAAPTRPRRVLLPAAPAEPHVVTPERRAQTGPLLTGEASIIARKIEAPAPIPTTAPIVAARTPPARDLSAALPDSPVLLAGMLLATGLVVPLWTFATRPPHPYNAFLLWNTLGLGLAGALLYGLNAIHTRREKRPPAAANRHHS